LFNPSLYLLFLFFLTPFFLSISFEKGDRMRSLPLLRENTGHFQQLQSYSFMCHLVFTYRTLDKSIFVCMHPWNAAIWINHTISKSHWRDAERWRPDTVGHVMRRWCGPGQQMHSPRHRLVSP
jgi:hypothetical protein